MGRHVFQARWAYDGAAQGGKKVAFGNTWVVAALVVRLPCCPSPVALPVLFRLWRGKGTASQVQLAAELTELLADAFPEREVHGTGDAAFHGEALDIEGTTWTTRLPSNAVLSGPNWPSALLGWVISGISRRRAGVRRLCCRWWRGCRGGPGSSAAAR